MAFVVNDDALGADVDLIVFAEELGALVRVLETELFSWHLFQLLLLFFLLGSHVPLAVQVVKNSEVFDELFDVGAKVAPAGRAG